MSQASTSSSTVGDGATANIELGASLLLWRRTVNSLKKTGSFESPPSRTSSSKSSSAIDIDIDKEGEEKRIRNDIPRVVKEQDLKLLLELGGVERIRTVLSGQRQRQRQQHSEFTPPVLPVHGTRFSSFLLNSCKHNRCTISMLLILAILYFAREFKQEGPKYGWHDGVAIVLALLLLVAFPSIRNFWRERQMMKLAKRKGKLEFTVQRGEASTPVSLPISDIVVVDMVCLGPGDEVPADGLFVNGDNDISVMAKEIKSKSDLEEKPFLIAGSEVIEGHGWMLIVASVGNRKMQRIGMGLLESLIEKPISDIDKVTLFIATLVAFVLLSRVICKKDADNGDLPEIKGKISVDLLMEVLKRMFLRPQGRISILTGLVTVVILCVQHGMPLMVTISLRYQAIEQDAVLNGPSACATMGLVTVICIDVTGGLKSKPMEVSRILMGETDISKVEGSETDLVVPDLLKQGVGLSVLAPELSLFPMFHSLVCVQLQLPIVHLNRPCFLQDVSEVRANDVVSMALVEGEFVAAALILNLM